MVVCKEWTIPVDMFRPLCTNEMQPEEGLVSCPVCIEPIDVPEGA